MRGKTNKQTNNKNLEGRPGRKNCEGKERVGKPETALANRRALGCLSELLAPLLLSYPAAEGARKDLQQWTQRGGPG